MGLNLTTQGRVSESWASEVQKAIFKKMENNPRLYEKQNLT